MSRLKAGKVKIMASEEEHENYKFQPIWQHVREETKVNCSSWFGHYIQLLKYCYSKGSSSEAVPCIAWINHWGLNHNKISSSLSLQIWRGKKWGIETIDVFCWLPRFIMMITMMMSSWRNVARIVNHWSPDAHQQNFSSQIFYCWGVFYPYPSGLFNTAAAKPPAWWLPAAKPVNPLPRPPWAAAVLGAQHREARRQMSPSNISCLSFIYCRYLYRAGLSAPSSQLCTSGGCRLLGRGRGRQGKGHE